MPVGTYSDFLTSVGQVESGNNYSFVSWPGYLGRYQFGEEALKAVGFYNGDNTSAIDFTGSWSASAAAYGVADKASFLASPAAQDAAMSLWVNKIVADLDTLGLRQYDGHVIKGVELTTSGLIAGAHLVGVWNLQSYLQSGGAVDPVDPNGEPVSDYIRRFNDFDTPYDSSASSSVTSGSTGATSTHTSDTPGTTTTTPGTSGGASTSDSSAGGNYADPATGLVLAGSNSLIGGAGGDTVTGTDSANYLRGAGGADVITGGSGFDDANGNTGDDTIHGGGGADWVLGGQGNDLLYGDDGNDVVYGNLGDDALDGGAGGDTVRGGQGDDVLNGAAGNDWLAGDHGNNTITGGAGADTFHVIAASGSDRVTDFYPAEGDRVQLDRGVQYTVHQDNADTVIDTAQGGHMVLVGVNASSLPTGWIFEA
jgi:Ca2+-binding RTX toxin-like protein